MIVQSLMMVKHAFPKRLLPRTWEAERLGDGPQEVALVGLLQQLGRWQSVLGHQPSVGVKRRDSTLAGGADGHLTSSANSHHERTRSRCTYLYAVSICLCTNTSLS